MKQFGRMPAETVEFFRNSVEQIRNAIPAALPASAGEAVRAYTMEKCLETVFRDWRENESNTELDLDDIADFRSFVAMSAALSGDDLNGSSFPVYQASLNGLLDDWLYNWNAAGNPGPP